MREAKRGIHSFQTRRDDEPSAVLLLDPGHTKRFKNASRSITPSGKRPRFAKGISSIIDVTSLRELGGNSVEIGLPAPPQPLSRTFRAR